MATETRISYEETQSQHKQTESASPSVCDMHNILKYDMQYWFGPGFCKISTR